MDGHHDHGGDPSTLSPAEVPDALANIGQVAQAIIHSALVDGTEPGMEHGLPDRLHGLVGPAGLSHATHSDTESDGELEEMTEAGMDPADYRMTTATVDSQAKKSDEAWTPQEEDELVKLVGQEDYRRSRLGDTTTKWAPIARHFSRTVKAVKRKYDKLQNPDKEQRKNKALPPRPAGAVFSMPHGYMSMVSHLHPSASEQLAGMYGGDPGSMGLPYYGAAPHGLTPEAAGALQHGLTPEQYSYLSGGAGFPGQAMGYAGLYEAGDGGAGAMHLPPNFTDVLMSSLQYGVPGTHPGAGGDFAAGLGAGGALGPGGAMPHHDRRFWNEADQQELLRLASDATYRQTLLGTTELNWDLIAKHLGRGKRSVQRKHDNLKGTSLPTGSGSSILPINDGKKWSPEEVGELLRLVEDGAYRKEVMGMEKVDWRILGQRFGRSYESVSYKYSYVKNTGRLETKTKHAKAKHETSYKEMAVWALQQLPGSDGTSGQICKCIMTNPQYIPQLDTAIVSGKKTLQRWKHGVRSALNAFNMFVKTGSVREGEVVWRLDGAALAAEKEANAEKAARQRNKPLSGAQRRKMKKAAAAREAAAAAGLPHAALGPGGEGEGGQPAAAALRGAGLGAPARAHGHAHEDAAHAEEGAHEALAQMAQARVPPGAAPGDAAAAQLAAAAQQLAAASRGKRAREDAGAGGVGAGKRHEAAPSLHEGVPSDVQLLTMMATEPLTLEQMNMLQAQLATPGGLQGLHLLSGGLTAEAIAQLGLPLDQGGAGAYPGAPGLEAFAAAQYATDYGQGGGDAAAAAAAAAAQYHEYYVAAAANAGFGAAELAAMQVAPLPDDATLAALGGHAGAHAGYGLDAEQQAAAHEQYAAAVAAQHSQMLEQGGGRHHDAEADYSNAAREG
ncbi:hypothetical protein ACKKBF_B10655 [Auxenochlorella protothecoides x Auxenochlorella symbiontica]